MQKTETEKKALSILPSWNDTSAKESIIEFVTSVTEKNNTDYIPPKDRIAVFDNDGTLWSEQPFYFQGIFVFERLRKLAPEHPEWNEKPLFRAVIQNDMKTTSTFGMKGLLELITETHSGMTTEEFEVMVREWLASARP